MKHIYWIRHCKAEGQPPEAPLTEEGKKQAEDLVGFFCDRGIERIVSSPFVRARDSVAPLAERLGLEIEIDDRLAERNLGDVGVEWDVDYEKALAQFVRTFNDRDLCYPGGESSYEATNRAIEAVCDLVSGEVTKTVVASHGNLTTLMLGFFDDLYNNFGSWQKLSNPDVYCLGFVKYGTFVFRQWRS